MTHTEHTSTHAGLTTRQAAAITGVAYLTNPVLFAQSFAMPRLIADDPVTTLQRVAVHPRLFGWAIVAYFFTLVGDVLMAWSLFYLLASVNRALSYLAALLRLVYAAMGFGALIFLAWAYRMATEPIYQHLYPPAELAAHLRNIVGGFRAGFDLSLAIFGLHLILLGWLIWKSTYPGRWVGLLLLPDGAAWVWNMLAPFVAPLAAPGFLQIFYAGEIVLMVWLLWFTWKLRPHAHAAAYDQVT